MSLQSVVGLLATEEPNSFLLPGDQNETWWSIAAFIIVVGLLYRFAWPSIVKGFKGRSEKIELELAAAEAAKVEAAAASDKIVAAVADADTEAARIVEEAATTAEALKIQLRQRADEEVSELRRRAASDIVASKNQAIADLQAEVSALALGAAETVVRRNLDATTQSSLIDDYINKVGGRLMADRIDVYADSLLPLVRAEDPSGRVADELYRVARLVESSDQLRETLSDPEIPAPRRQQVVEELLGEQVQPLTLGIVSLLVGAGRVTDLPRIVDSIVAKNALDSSRALAEVRSAVSLTPEQTQRLSVALEKAIGRPVDLKVVVDPSVLGGLVAQIGDTVIDGSVRTRLSQLREVL